MRAAALPGCAEFFASWLGAADDHSHSTAPPEPALLRDYRPKVFGPDDFAALEAFTQILIPHRRHAGPSRSTLRTVHRFRAATFLAPQTQKLWWDATTGLRAAGFHAADGRGREALASRDDARDHAGLPGSMAVPSSTR